MLKQLIFFLSVSYTCFGAKYNCSLSYDHDFCSISLVKSITEPDDKIEPVAENPTNVTALFLEGIIPILTGGFCEVLPNLEYFSSKWVVEAVKDSAFDGCTNIKEINMFNEPFTTKLDKNTFKGLKKLTNLMFYNGNIPVFDVDLSDLKELKFLSLSSLNISEFPADTLREQQKLEDLILFSNELIDLDVEGILKYTPNLKKIVLRDNNFKCSRVRKIQMLLKEKNIKTPPMEENESKIYKERAYTPEIIDGIHCLSDEKWDELYSNIGVKQEVQKKKIASMTITERLSKLEQANLELNENVKDLLENLMKLINEKIKKFNV